MYFLIADTHMGHENICRYCNRPRGFENLVMERWRERVRPEDVVIHLGDLSFEEAWVRKLGALPGRKILIRGNHDRLPTETYLEAGWLVMEAMVLKLAGLRIVCSHRPMFGHDYDFNIHGHQHDLHVLDDTRLYLPVALEHTRYAPVAMDESFMGALRSFADRNRQPTTEEIQALLGSDRPLEERDYYGGFGREDYENRKKRLMEGYRILSAPEAARSPRGYQRFHDLRRYVEGTIERDELERKIRKEAFWQERT